MARSQRHESREYLGETKGRAVAQWLNLNRDKAKGQMLARLVRGFWRKGKGERLREDDMEMFSREWYREMDELARQARAHGLVIRRGRIVFTVDPFLKLTTPFWCIQALASLGVADRVRECRRCREWFFARFHHQSFCSSKCQQYYYQRSEAGKSRRRKYMREYRRDEGLRNLRALQQAKKDRR